MTKTWEVPSKYCFFTVDGEIVLCNSSANRILHEPRKPCTRANCPIKVDDD